MKTLALFRHAKSSWDDTGLDDHDRPLAARGHRDAPRMAERLALLEFRPELLLASTALRARQTAEYLAAALGVGKDRTRFDRRIYLASPGELLDVIAATDGTVGSLLLVGHNPGLTELVNRLLPELRLLNLPTAGVVAIDCAIADWARFDRAEKRLRFFESPKSSPQSTSQKQ